MFTHVLDKTKRKRKKSNKFPSRVASQINFHPELRGHACKRFAQAGVKIILN